MARREIVRLGHPSLRTPARALPTEELGGEELGQLVADMIETMKDAGGVGLAAPQLGIEQQIFVWESPEDEEVAAIINPMLEPEAGELVYDWEGCLSVPDLRGLVPRHPAVRLHGLRPDGTAVDQRLEGPAARIVQHEFDHLNGITFLDRMRDLKSLSFSREWELYLTAEDEGEPPMG